MAIKWKTKIILAKLETAYGVVPTPAPAAANAMLMKNVELRPMEGQDVSRDLEMAYIGAQEQIPVGLYQVLTGEFECVGSGQTGVAPGWSPLIRMCGVAEIVTPDDDPDDGTVEYLPVTEGHESGSIYFWIGPTRFVMKGVRGTLELTLSAQAIPVFKVTLTGMFTVASDQARIAPNVSAFQVPQVATMANTPGLTLDDAPFVLREFGFNLANAVEQRLLIGREEIVITDRNETISFTVEATPLATYNPFQIALDRTRQELKLSHGTAVGRRFLFEADTFAQNRPSGFANNQNVLEWPLAGTPMPVAGDDQWRIRLT